MALHIAIHAVVHTPEGAKRAVKQPPGTAFEVADDKEGAQFLRRAATRKPTKDEKTLYDTLPKVPAPNWEPGDPARAAKQAAGAAAAAATAQALAQGNFEATVAAAVAAALAERDAENAKPAKGKAKAASEGEGKADPLLG